MKISKAVFIFFFVFGMLSSGAIAKTENCFASEEGKSDQEYENGKYFGSIDNYDKTLLKTAISALTHSCIVTQKESSKTFELLEEKGWNALNEQGSTAKKIEDGIIEPRAGRAYVAHNKKINTLVVVFRGTGVKGMGQGYKLKLLKNALTDSNLLLKKIAWLPEKTLEKWKGLTEERFEEWKGIKVHHGFNKEYKRFIKTIDKRISSFLKKQKKTPAVYCLGFSLGAALATHCGAHLKLRFGIDPKVLVGASPRVGGKAFQEAYDKLIKSSARLMLEKDPVPQIPGNLLKRKYKHIGHRLLPLYHDRKIGERLKKTALKLITHTWGNARVGRDILRFIKYHNYLEYKKAIRKHLIICKSKCKGGVLKSLARAERDL